ncbi:MAG TPA: O-antigen polymerase [Gemmatimonadaceae bacterium]|nr:O-antigen polymerase [Gemmatimonadaceae bacterium]
MGNAGALALSMVLIGWAASMRAMSGTWLQPSAFFPLWWCCAGILPLIFAPQEPVGSNAMVWLIAASIAVSIGAFAGNWGFRTKRVITPTQATDRELRLFGVALSVALLLGLASNLTFILGSSIPLGDILDIEKLVVVSNKLYIQRYAESGPPPPPPLSQALLPFVYLAPAVGGILFVLRREMRWKVFALLSYLPAIAVTILQTTKAAVLFSMVLWLSGYFATRLRFGKLAVFTKAHLITASAVVGVVTIFFFAVSLARMASTDFSLLGVVVDKLLIAAFGHMTVFSQWLGEYWQEPASPSLGKVTFAGPLELLGYTQRVPGLFESVVNLIMGDTSNIYTGFRPLIQDFTIPGALAILSVLGFIGGIGFRLVAQGKWSAVPLLLIAYVTILWTPITWFWIYNSLTATVFAVALMVFVVRLWRGAPYRREPGKRFATS